MAGILYHIEHGAGFDADGDWNEPAERVVAEDPPRRVNIVAVLILMLPLGAAFWIGVAYIGFRLCRAL